MREEQLRKALEQNRARLENQKEMMNQVGDRALRNIRLNVGIIGLLLSVVGIRLSASSGPTLVSVIADGVPNFAFYTAVGAAVLSVLCGLFAYVATPSVVGFSTKDSKRAREMIKSEIGDNEFLQLLLRSQENWMEQNRQAQRIDTILLNGSIALLLLEIEYFAISVVSVVSNLSRTTSHGLVFVATFVTVGPLMAILIIKFHFPGK